jgi:hydroxymethylpyrimidine/phosphomethylpyrimidine kinase
MGNVVPDRFFWALPGEGEEEDGEPGADVAPAGDADAVTAPKNPRHVH